MAVKRRLGVENAKNRELLIDVTWQLLYEDGYAALTARKVAAKAGLKVQLVYYYFESMDDLIRAVIKKYTAQRLERFNQAINSSDPLKMLWELNSDPKMAISATEVIALANHRQPVRAEIVAAAQQFRKLQIDVVKKLLAAKGMDPEKYPAAAIVTIVAALARAMGQDCALGVDEGYTEALKLVEQGLKLLSSAGPANSGATET